jgi:hypothetical protein
MSWLTEINIIGVEVGKSLNGDALCHKVAVEGWRKEEELRNKAQGLYISESFPPDTVTAVARSPG